VREKDVDKVGEEDRPEERYRAEEEEGRYKKRNAQSMPENNEGLKAAFEWNVKGCPADTVVKVRTVKLAGGELCTRSAPIQHLLVFR